VRAERIAVGFSPFLLRLRAAVELRLRRLILPPTATNQLVTLLKSIGPQWNSLTQQVEHLYAEIRQRLSAESAARQLEARLIDAEMLAGTIPVSGPGLVIHWTNGSAPSDYQSDDIDLERVVNELSAGVEAIAVKGQRITVTSEVRKAANFRLINTSQQALPFTVTAIGNASTMTDALTWPGRLLQQGPQEGQRMMIIERASFVVRVALPPPVHYAYRVS
jgi:uncharacterized protein YlxW (UPF0749 family)